MKKTNFKYGILTLCLILLLTSLTACGRDGKSSNEENSNKKIVKNLDGTDIIVPTKVEKVGAIFGPSYERIVMLGAEDKIVCNGDFHINGWPWSNIIYKRINEIPGIPNAHSELNVEDLAGYDMDVIFNFPNPNTTKALEASGIAVIPYAGTNKFTDIKESIFLYAEVLGDDAPSIAIKYGEYFDNIVEKISSVTKDIPTEDRPSVYFANQKILWTEGNQSDIGEIVQLAGGNYIASEIPGGSKMEISREEFIAWNPDFIFVDHAGSSGNETAEMVVNNALKEQDFNQINAVKNNNVYIVPTGVFFWDSGVQKPLMALYIAKTIHPDKFIEVDMSKELQHFYREFFNYELNDEQANRILSHLDPK